MLSGISLLVWACWACYVRGQLSSLRSACDFRASLRPELSALSFLVFLRFKTDCGAALRHIKESRFLGSTQ